ncbi:addiction module antidote protein [Halarcobacter anaerophilus]|uniref:addiction module antidote protein n=1 Tax=Halarcobacter anaerophilus TaxID=877500 RepID=UPI0005C819EA|nr:addiction module antidote protein [Halarcobacter anaerophilus]
MKNSDLREFDITNYLDNKEIIAEYLTQVLEEGDMDELFLAIGNVAKAKGISTISKDTGLGRESLYKTFKKGSKPRFDTVLKVLSSLGIQLKATA